MSSVKSLRLADARRGSRRARDAGSRGTRARSGSTSSTGTTSSLPAVPAQIETVCSSTGYGEYCGCLSSSISRPPRSSCWRDAASRSEANIANASIARNCARSTLSEPVTLLIALTMRGATHAGHRHADVDGRALVGVEQVGLQEDLAVGDRDDVGRDVGRDVVGLGLDDRQAGHRARAHVVGQLRAALEQPAVQVEDVAGVGLATRRAAQQQRHGAVGLGLLGQVVEDDQDVLAVVHPVLADGRAGVGREVLEAGRVGRRAPPRSWCTPARRPPRARRAPRRSSSPSGRSRRRCSGPAGSGRRTPRPASG